MSRQGLVRFVRNLSSDGQVYLRETNVGTSAGNFVLAHARIRHQDSDVDGYGTAKTRDAAIDRALWETVERHAFRFLPFHASDFRPFSRLRRLTRSFRRDAGVGSLPNLGSHSVGCAVHASESRAIAAAVGELIERHTVLVAQLQACPGYPIDRGRLNWNQRELRIQQYCWIGPMKRFCVLSEVTDCGDDRTVYSTGSGDSLQSASEKSWTEAIQMAENFEIDARTPALHEIRTISDLKRWHMTNKDRRPFYRGQDSPEAPPKIDAALNSADFWIATKPLGYGLHFARAYSPSVQNLFAGCWREERTNSRFQSLWNAKLEPPYAY